MGDALDGSGEDVLEVEVECKEEHEDGMDGEEQEGESWFGRRDLAGTGRVEDTAVRLTRDIKGGPGRSKREEREVIVVRERALPEFVVKTIEPSRLI